MEKLQRRQTRGEHTKRTLQHSVELEILRGLMTILARVNRNTTIRRSHRDLNLVVSLLNRARTGRHSRMNPHRHFRFKMISFHTTFRLCEAVAVES